MKIYGIAAGLVFFLAASSFAADMCPAVKTNVSEDFIMRERDFHDEAALKAVADVRKSMDTLLTESKTAKEARDSPLYYISFPNGLKIIEGTLLKQRALIAQKEYELAKAGGDAAKQQEAKLKYENAKKAFCKFLENAFYLD